MWWHHFIAACLSLDPDVAISAWKPLAGSDNFWVFLLTIWSCDTLETFNASWKWMLSELTHHLPHSISPFSGSPHIWVWYFHSLGCPDPISKPLSVLPSFSSPRRLFCEVNEAKYGEYDICDTWNILGTQWVTVHFFSTFPPWTRH